MGQAAPEMDSTRETNGWLSLFKCKPKPKASSLEILGKIGAPQCFLRKT